VDTERVIRRIIEEIIWLDEFNSFKAIYEVNSIISATFEHKKCHEKW